jgi:hypothetical protein
MTLTSMKKYIIMCEDAIKKVAYLLPPNFNPILNCVNALQERYN